MSIKDQDFSQDQYFITITDPFNHTTVCKITTYEHKLMRDHPDLCATEDFEIILAQTIQNPDSIQRRGVGTVNPNQYRYNFYKELGFELEGTKYGEENKFVKAVVEYSIEIQSTNENLGDVVTVHLLNEENYKKDVRKNVEILYQTK
jgi:hypothetical protein